MAAQVSIEPAWSAPGTRQSNRPRAIAQSNRL